MTEHTDADDEMDDVIEEIVKPSVIVENGGRFYKEKGDVSLMEILLTLRLKRMEYLNKEWDLYYMFMGSVKQMRVLIENCPFCDPEDPLSSCGGINHMEYDACCDYYDDIGGFISKHMFSFTKPCLTRLEKMDRALEICDYVWETVGGPICRCSYNFFKEEVGIEGKKEAQFFRHAYLVYSGRSLLVFMDTPGWGPWGLPAELRKFLPIFRDSWRRIVEVDLKPAKP